MIKTIPSKAPNIIKSGHNTYKPEMNGAIIMQISVIQNLLKDKYKNKSLKELYEIAEEKRYEETCDYLENAFNG